MSNQAYWEKRQKQLWSQLETDEKKLTGKLSKKYDKETKSLEKQIAYYYKSYGEDNIIQYRKLMEQLPDVDKRLLIEQMDNFMMKYPEHADLMPVRETIYKLNRMEGMRESIYIQQMQMGAMEQRELEEHLKTQYGRGYGAMAKEIGHGSAFNYLNQDVLKKTINNKWCNGKNFSDSIWNNRTKLAEYLNNDFAAAMARGDSYERCMKQLRGRFGRVSRRDMFNLIYTEGTYIMNEATITPFEEDFEEYMISIADDEACPICKGMRGKTFKIKERKPGVNFPPLHTCCRCDKTIILPANFVDSYVKKHGKNSVNSGIIKEKEFEPVQSIMQAEQYAKNTLGIKNVSYKGVDLETANEWNKGLNDSFTKFPELKGNFGFVGEAHERNEQLKPAMYQMHLEKYKQSNPGISEDALKPYAERDAKKAMRRMAVSKDTLAESWSPKHSVLKEYAGVSVNRDWGKDSSLFRATLENNVESKFHPEGCGTIRSVLDHEIGHQIDNLLSVRTDKDIQKLYHSMTKTEITENLSRYAWDNNNSDNYSEFIAEAWAEYCNNSNPREIAQKTGEIIERKYTEWKKKNL